MPITLRRAEARDAAGIARVMRTLWPDDTADPDRIATAAADSAHEAHVAEAGGEIVGFVDGFLTLSKEGIVRWEVDLLGVRPEWQGQGIASRLIEASVEAGRRGQAALARALVRVDNAAAERAFEKAGFTTAQPCLLVVRSGTSAVLPSFALHRGIMIVRTFSYRGVWMEAPPTADNLRLADAVRVAYGLDQAGAVIAETNTFGLQAAEAAGYARVGRYRWWALLLK